MLARGLDWNSTIAEALGLWLEKKSESGTGQPTRNGNTPSTLTSNLAAAQSVETLLAMTFPPTFFKRVKSLTDSRLIPCVSAVRVGLELWCLANEHKDVFTEALHKVAKARRALRAQSASEISPADSVETSASELLAG
jgi:hypothetical protein